MDALLGSEHIDYDQLSDCGCNAQPTYQVVPGGVIIAGILLGAGVAAILAAVMTGDVPLPKQTEKKNKAIGRILTSAVASTVVGLFGSFALAGVSTG